ncbi:MAG: FAD-dependent oxidoreductase, partial [bacterium]|nr:FAD-dependent oxidoreductase [bacterium]
ALAHRGVDVSVVELLPQVLAPLDADMAAAVAMHLHGQGVTLHLGDAVESFKHAKGRVSGVVLKSGQVIETDLVLMTIGVRPNVALAKDAGLEIGARGGIKVNRRMETNDPHILAAGDAVEVTHLVTGESVLIPLAGPANKHGRLAGEIAATDNQTPAPAPAVAGTAVVKVFDLTIAMTGLTRKAAERAGVAAEHVMVKRGHHVGYYPGAEEMTVKLVYEPSTRRVLGAQIVGGAGVDRRIDVVATALHFRGTVDDLAALDLAYAPPYGAAKDPVNIAGFVAQNQERGLVKHVDPAEVDALVARGYQLVDVRSPEEFATGAIPGALNVWVDDLKANVHKLSPDQPILAYCGVGQRSYYAARALAGLGRADVVSLAGGLGAYAIHCAAAGLAGRT